MYSIFLFSGLGLFSFFLLINFGQFSEQSRVKITTTAGYLFAVLFFNFLGFVIIRLSRWVDSVTFPYSLHKVRLPLTYSMAALILLIINYLILVGAKILIGEAQPLVFPNGGHRILIAVWLIELVVVGLLLANRSAVRSVKLQKEAARLQRENDSAKYEALQNQLNPHFLFNSLNTLVAEIEYNPKNAVMFTRKLSGVYRYVLQCQQMRTVLLQDEAEFLESYIFLHSVRMGDCIKIDNHIDKACEDMKIAPLSLQLLAENVIKHNIINEDIPMNIVLRTDEKGEFLIFSNTLRRKLSDTSSGIGLKNLSNRYMLLCGRDIEIRCDESEKLFEVKIPLIYE